MSTPNHCRWRTETWTLRSETFSGILEKQAIRPSRGNRSSVHKTSRSIIKPPPSIFQGLDGLTVYSTEGSRGMWRRSVRQFGVIHIVGWNSQPDKAQPAVSIQPWSRSREIRLKRRQESTRAARETWMRLSLVNQNHMSVDAFWPGSRQQETIDKGDDCWELIGVVERGECARFVCHTWEDLHFYLAQSEQNDWIQV